MSIPRVRTSYLRLPLPRVDGDLGTQTNGRTRLSPKPARWKSCYDFFLVILLLELTTIFNNFTSQKQKCAAVAIPRQMWYASMCFVVFPMHILPSHRSHSAWTPNESIIRWKKSFKNSPELFDLQHFPPEFHCFTAASLHGEVRHLPMAFRIDRPFACLRSPIYVSVHSTTFSQQRKWQPCFFSCR